MGQASSLSYESVKQHMRSKTAIRITATLLVLLAVAVCVWSSQSEVAVPVPSTGPAPVSIKRDAEVTPEDKQLDSRWQLVYAHRFQRPLFDPPPPKPPPEVKREIPPPAIKLVATMTKASGGLAYVKNSAGNSASYRIGDTIESAGTTCVLLRVHADSIEVQREDRVFRITLENR